MNTYEMMCIFNTKSASPTKTTDLMDSILENHGAVIEKKEDLGTKKFAYPIKKKNEGHYWLYHFKSDTEKIDAMNKEILIKDSILRHMVIWRNN